MRCRRMFLVAGLLSAGSQAYAPLQMVTGPAKGRVILPEGALGNIRGIVAPQQLSVGLPTASGSPSMIPYFTAKLDQTISWDDLGWCLEAIGDTSGDAVRVNECSGKQAQKWDWIPDGEGSNRIQLTKTNLCMDVNANDAGSNGVPLALRDCGKGVTTWKLEELSPVPGNSANDSLSYEARHVLISLMTLAGLGAAGVGVYLLQRGEAQHQGSIPSSVDQEMVPAVMLVNPMQPSSSGQPRAAHSDSNLSRNLVSSIDPMHFQLDRRALVAACCASTVPMIQPQRADATEVETKSALIELSKNVLLPQDAVSSTADASSAVLDDIAWDAPKRRGLTDEQMAEAINDGLREREWFVTGRGLPQYFSSSFSFSDPDVSLDGFEPYCRQVRRLFDQSTARCEVVCCSATAPNTIKVVWRNSGKVNIGPLGIELKPYVVTSTLKTDAADGNLIVSQEDTFVSQVPALLLWQVPALRPLAGPPAPSVDVLRQQCDIKTCTLAAL